MADTSIEWADVVWNPVVGCSRVSAGCENCYAEKVAHRGMSPEHRGLTVLGKAGIRWNGTVRFLPERLGEPLRWRKPRRVFVNSMSDLFHEKLTDEQIAAVFGVMAACPSHTFQVLTKRPARMREWFAWVASQRAKDGAALHPAAVAVQLAAESLGKAGRVESGEWVCEIGWLAHLNEAREGRISWPLPNVWLGVSAEDQAAADARIPILLDTPAAVRWVSYEPALGPIDFAHIAAFHVPPWPASLPGEPKTYLDVLRGEGLRPSTLTGVSIETYVAARIDWIVVGGESGAGARPFDIAWARSVIDQCEAARVPCFVKQLGASPFYRSPIAPSAPADDRLDIVLRDRKGGDWSEWNEDLRVREFPAEVSGG